MKKYILPAIFLFSLNVHATLSGVYQCTGSDYEHPNVIYKGLMEIRKNGQTFSIKSSYSDNVSSIGTGIYNKTKHSFVFVFANPKQTKETGIASMYVDKNNNMKGDWAYLNKSVIGHTSCFKTK